MAAKKTTAKKKKKKAAGKKAKAKIPKRKTAKAKAKPKGKRPTKRKPTSAGKSKKKKAKTSSCGGARKKKRTVTGKNMPLKGKVKKKKPRNKAKKKNFSSVLSSAQVRQTLIETGGENALAVIQEFSTDLTDGELARRAKIRGSEVRSALNRLHSGGLVKYTRNRDKESGWYTYLWSVDEEKLNRLNKNEEGGEEVNRREHGEHYFCQNCSENRKIPFEEATDLLFKCRECGSYLKYLEDDEEELGEGI